MKIVVALYKVNTQANQQLSVATRVNNVSAAVEAARKYTESQGTAFWKNKKALRAIFLAPEYSFARSVPKGHIDHDFGMKRQMDEDYVKNQLRPVFGALSRGFENALIVPGTVAWRKSLLPTAAGRHATPAAAEQYRRQKYERRIDDAVRINLAMRREDLPFTEHSPVFPVDFKRRDDPREQLDTAAAKKALLRNARYIAKNTAHCYYNGDCIYKYNKIGDFYEVPEQNPDTVMVPNRSRVTGNSVAAGRFALTGLEFGIAICYDQSLSVQPESVDVVSLEPLQRTADPVDFHILLSAHITPYVSAANLKPGGRLLSCSSDDQCNGVFDAQGQCPGADESIQLADGACLDIYELD